MPSARNGIGLLQYHFYSGFSALNIGLSNYFTADSIHFNPYAYVHSMSGEIGSTALAVGSVLAVIHSVVLWSLTTACNVVPSEDPKERFLSARAATVLAFMNPILLQQIARFSDITTTVVLGGCSFWFKPPIPRTTPVVFRRDPARIATA